MNSSHCVRVCVDTGDVNLNVSAKALNTPTLCGNEVSASPDVGRIDTVIRTLLVEVSETRAQTQQPTDSVC